MAWDTPTCDNCDGWGCHPDDRPLEFCDRILGAAFGMELKPNLDGSPASYTEWQGLVAGLKTEAEFKKWQKEQQDEG